MKFLTAMILLFSATSYADYDDTVDITDSCPVPPQDKPEEKK